MFEDITLGTHSVNTALNKDKLCHNNDGEGDMDEDV
jgi:hypothetical protein